jgi:hypothetical protein
MTMLPLKRERPPENTKVFSIVLITLSDEMANPPGSEGA